MNTQTNTFALDPFDQVARILRTVMKAALLEKSKLEPEAPAEEEDYKLYAQDMVANISIYYRYGGSCLDDTELERLVSSLKAILANFAGSVWAKTLKKSIDLAGSSTLNESGGEESSDENQRGLIARLAQRTRGKRARSVSLIDFKDLFRTYPAEVKAFTQEAILKRFAEPSRWPRPPFEIYKASGNKV